MRTATRMVVLNSKKYVLDLISAIVAAAYSLRRLYASYTGAAIRVRRSSDNAEIDIGFIGEHLDLFTLFTFVGSGNGFVTTWYDQSGNGRHATQTTLGAQPSILLSGLVQTEVGKPAIIFNGTTHRLSVPTSALTLTSNTIVSVAKSSTIGDYWGAMINAISINDTNNPWLPLGQGAIERHYWNENYFAIFDNDWLNRAVRTHRYDFSGVGYSLEVWRNGVSVATGGRLDGNWSAIAEIGIGGLVTGTVSGIRGGIAQEIVFFPSTLSTTDRQKLEGNQGLYYNISVS